MRSYPTANDLNSNAKKVAIELLNARVADTIDLALLTKQAHWNLKGTTVHRRTRDAGRLPWPD